MNESVKNKIKWKNKMYKTYVKNGFTDNRHLDLQDVTNVVTVIINVRKQEYFDQLTLKLNNLKTSFKTYLSKTFYNGKKIPLIPPLLVNNCLIADFKVKADLFNNFFASQCTPLENSSNIPNNQLYFTDAKIDTIQFNDNGILNAIRNLNTSKADGMMT